MLIFNPERQLTLDPNDQHRLQTSLTINNPSNRSAPFKVKSTRPTLFHVEPSTGLIRPRSSVTVTIKTKETNSSQLAHEVSYHNRFLVEFALIERYVSSPEQGIRLISQTNKQEHKLFLVVSGRAEHDRDDKSSASAGFAYRTVPDQEDYQRGFDKDKYGGLNEEQKDQYLTRELGRLEKEKSELYMSPKPRGNFTMWKIVAIFLIALLLGNLLGHSLGLGSESKQEAERQEKQEQQEEGFGWFGLAQYWRQPQKKKEQPWWQFYI